MDSWGNQHAFLNMSRVRSHVASTCPIIAIIGSRPRIALRPMCSRDPLVRFADLAATC